MMVPPVCSKLLLSLNPAWNVAPFSFTKDEGLDFLFQSGKCLISIRHLLISIRRSKAQYFNYRICAQCTSSELLVTTVTEVSPPFLGVPQIWRSRSGYKSIAVSFCDQLVCSRLLATQTRTSARDPVVSARGVRSELAEGGSSAPLWYVGGFSAAFPRRLRPVSPAEFALFQWPTTGFLEPGLEHLLFGDQKLTSPNSEICTGSC